jgi:hypothetical protein
MESQAHTSKIPQNNLPSIFAIVYDDLIKTSPCACRPDTKKPCGLLRYPKTSNLCKNCGFLHEDGHIPTDEEIAIQIEIGFDLKPETPPPLSKRHERKPCSFPGCKTLTYGEYCQSCGSMVRNRQYAYEKRHPGKRAPVSLLHRKRRPYNSRPTSSKFY